MVDEMLEYLRTARRGPVWRPVPAEVRERLTGPVPREPTPVGEVLNNSSGMCCLPHGNIHPRFWGWVIGTGTRVASSPTCWLPHEPAGC